AGCGSVLSSIVLLFFFQAEDGIRDGHVTGVQTCALPIFLLFWDPGHDCRAANAGRSVVCAPSRQTESMIVPLNEITVLPLRFFEIGRASCRERVLISAGALVVQDRSLNRRSRPEVAFFLP